MAIPVLSLDWAKDAEKRVLLLVQLREALFSVGFLYITNHGVAEDIISSLASQAPALFSLSDRSKSELSKIHSPHFLGYSGVGEERTQGKDDWREQFDFATELPVVYREDDHDQRCGRDFSKPFWRLRGPNQWPNEDEVPGFKEALLK